MRYYRTRIFCFQTMLRKALQILGVLTLALFTACGGEYYNPLLYKLPILQGNVIERDQVDRLEIGMNKRQVRYLLGTPLVESSFEQDRWDYIFYFKNQRGQVIENSMSVFFDSQGLLARIAGERELGTNVDIPELPDPTTRGTQPEDPSLVPGQPRDEGTDPILKEETKEEFEKGVEELEEKEQEEKSEQEDQQAQSGEQQDKADS